MLSLCRSRSSLVCPTDAGPDSADEQDTERNALFFPFYVHRSRCARDWHHKHVTDARSGRFEFICLSMVLTPIKKPHCDFVRGREEWQTLLQLTLPRRNPIVMPPTCSAPRDFQTPTGLDNRVWQTGKAISHVILTSQKNSLRWERRQTITRASLWIAAPRYASLTNQVPIDFSRKTIGRKPHRP